MSLLLPAVVITAAFAPFAVVAIAMVVITIFVLGQVLPADRHPPLVTQMLLALAVLGGGTILLLSLVLVFVNPDGTSAWTWVLLAFNFMMMAPAGIWFMGLVAFKDRRVEISGWTWPVLLALVTTGSEALMGFLFAFGAPSSPPPAPEAAASGLASVWFFWSMGAVMVALVVWAPLDRIERNSLVALTTTALLAPWVTAFPTVGGLAMTALMAVVFLLLVRVLLDHRVTPGELGLLFGLAVAFLAMALAGLYLAVDQGGVSSTIAFGSVMAVVMGVEVAYLIRRFYRGPAGRPWLTRRADDAVVELPGPPAVRPGLDAHPSDATVALR
jgi:hypothetical protein